MKNTDTIPITEVYNRPRKVKRLFWDTEVSPNTGYFWKTGYKLTLLPENIVTERAVITIAYKWEGENKVYVLSWDKNKCDKKMLQDFMLIANVADELVAHNGDKFDIKWFFTRCLFHGLPPLPDYKCRDTLKLARNKFYFNSNKLDYIAQFLGLGQKIKTGFGLWKDVLSPNAAIAKKAMQKMKRYNKHDVILLEKVWKKLVLFVPAKTHAGVLMKRDKWTCPRTGSKDVKIAKTRVTASGTKQYQMQSKSGGYYTISEELYRDYCIAKNKPL